MANPGIKVYKGRLKGKNPPSKEALAFAAEWLSHYEGGEGDENAALCQEAREWLERVVAYLDREALVTKMAEETGATMTFVRDYLDRQ